MSSAPIPNSGDPRVDAALGHIGDRFPDLIDAMVIHIDLNAFAGAGMSRRAERAADHLEWMNRFQDKLDALTSIIVRREGGAESHPV